MSEEYIPDDEFKAPDDEFEAEEDVLEFPPEELETEEEFEEITSEEVDRVVDALHDLMQTVDSENIKLFLEDALDNVYYLIYDDEEDDVDLLSEAA